MSVWVRSVVEHISDSLCWRSYRNEGLCGLWFSRVYVRLLGVWGVGGVAQYLSDFCFCYWYCNACEIQCSLLTWESTCKSSMCIPTNNHLGITENTDKAVEHLEASLCISERLMKAGRENSYFWRRLKETYVDVMDYSGNDVEVASLQDRFKVHCNSKQRK